MIVSFFVYGTLKRGECRAQMWPVEPLSVVPAFARGTLFDRDDYPAMLRGSDRVHGECWQFDSGDAPAVVAALDRIEGANQPGIPDLYQRVTVEVLGLEADLSVQAYTYHYASDPLLDGFRRMTPNEGGFVSWPAG
ncbi:MAG: gamma-glutamylcyclotransferase [Rubripirellula sp.]